MADIPQPPHNDVGIVVIGRNEGDRLVRCLASIEGKARQIVYVDSGSTDRSIERAITAGAEVLELDTRTPFTAARARNAGAQALKNKFDIKYIHFLDGDCEVRDGWLEAAFDRAEANAAIAVVCGRRRERFPETTLWNHLTDLEWAGASGEVGECGGDALMRRAAFEEVGGFDEALIAGEEPELCFRLRQKGWKIWRLDAEMAWHDAAMTRFGQWWLRSKRAGFAYANGAWLHGRSPEKFRLREVARALFWGAALPLAALLGAVFSAWFLALLLAFPLQYLRLLKKGNARGPAFFLVLGKFAEAQGIFKFVIGQTRKRRAALIEYK